MLVSIDDAQDPRLNAFRWRERQLTTIAQRKAAIAEGLFIAEGDLVVQRALEAGCVPDVVLCDPKCGAQFATRVDAAGGTTLVASADIRREVTGLGVPLDAIGVFKRPPLISCDDMIAAATRLIVLDCVDNPSNVGSIARTAAALGWDGLLLDSTSADPLSRRALRVSMGTTFKLAFARFANTGDMLNNLQQHGFSTIGLTPHHQSREVADLRTLKVSGKRAVVLGSERQGLSDTSLELCSQLATIQMAKGVDSLNVASASAIACFALL
ncbi:MAG: hypothetical protein RIS37_1158 [Actinomycetota bacterium]